jgi:anti-sigma regulatory factor (Ser/Thr protein kinase)
VKAPDLEQYVEKRMKGGLGLHLVKKLNDEVRYERIGNRNIFTLVKTIEI